MSQPLLDLRPNRIAFGRQLFYFKAMMELDLVLSFVYFAAFHPSNFWAPCFAHSYSFWAYSVVLVGSYLFC